MAAAPWFALRCNGNPLLRAIPYLKDLGLEIYYPLIRELRPVPRDKLSRGQRASGVVIMRPRNVPFIHGVVFARGRPQGVVETFKRRPAHHFVPGERVEAGDLNQRTVAWDDVFAFPGLMGFLSNTEDPGLVLTFELDELRGREIDGVIAGKTPARMLFRTGEEVRVAHGPFTTFSGIIVEVPDATIEDIDADTRLKLTIDIFGRATPLTLSAWQIEKL
jgi:hypothetical protein